MAENEMKAMSGPLRWVRLKEWLGVATCWRLMGSARRQVTCDTELVAIGISEVGAIEVLVVFGPQSRRAFGFAAVRQCYGIRPLDDCSAFSKKRDHLAVPALMRQLVVGHADQEEWPGIRTRLPARPRTPAVTEAGLHPKRGHQWIVETERPLKVADTNEDV